MKKALAFEPLEPCLSFASFKLHVRPVFLLIPAKIVKVFLKNSKLFSFVGTGGIGLVVYQLFKVAGLVVNVEFSQQLDPGNVQHVNHWFAAVGVELCNVSDCTTRKAD